MKLFIGLPIYSTCPAQFMQCIVALQHHKPKFKEWFGSDFEFELHYCQGDGIARSRNQLTASFLKTDCTHMLMIDCDIIFDATQVAALLKRDLDVVAGAYAKKQQGKLEWVINTYPGMPRATDDGLQRVAYVGTGFIMIKRRVFELMIQRWPECRYRADYGSREIEYDLWPMAVHGPGSASWRIDNARRLLAASNINENPMANTLEEIEEALNGPVATEGLGRYLSEDWFFCQRWNDLKGEVWLDCRVALKHLGPAVFPLDSQIPQMMEPDSYQEQESPSSGAAA